MKKQLLPILLTMQMCMVGANAYAYDIAVDNADGKTICYNYINDGRELAVTLNPLYGYSGDVVIPEEVTYLNITRKVTCIGEKAFKNSDLTSVFIPNSVIRIEEDAFLGCDGLTSIVIPNSVTYIGFAAFSLCRGLTSILLPNNETRIGVCAFEGCSSLTSIIIPKNVISIGSQAFRGCSGLTSIKVEKGNMNYDSRNNCNAIIDSNNQLILGCKNTMIPNSVTSIGPSAFYGCSDLHEINLPNSLRSIGNAAFADCSNLFDIVSEIENPFYIDNAVFEGIPSHSRLIVPYGTKWTYQAATGWSQFSNIEEVKGDGKVFVFGGIFYYIINENNVGITHQEKIIIPCHGDIVIPSQVTYRGKTYNVTVIGQKAFEEFTRITSVVIPNSITSIGIQAFALCNRLTTVVSEIENPFDIAVSVFADIPSDAQLIVPIGTKAAYQAAGWNMFQNIVEAGGDVIEDDNGVDDSGKCGDNVYYSYNEATHSLTITGTGAMTDYNYGHDEAPWFSYANEIQKIEIESGITTIGNFAFYKCSNITAIDIPATLTSIGSSAFEECSSLTSLTLNEGLETIKGSAFESCTGLKNITLPSTINTIQMNAFKNCTGLTDVYCYAESIPDTDDAAFDGTPTEKATLHVPASAVEAYKGKWPWSTFKEIVDESTISGTCGENVSYSYDKATHTLTIFGQGEMYGYDPVGSDYTPWNSYSNDIQSVIIESGVTSIGTEAFSYCRNLTSVTIPNSVTTIYGRAFMDCSSLSSVIIPNSVTNIKAYHGTGAFSGCSGLYEINLPNSLISIDDHAFQGCSNLSYIVSEIENPFGIAGSVFEGIPSNAQLIVPIGTKAAYQAAEGWNVFQDIVEAGGGIVEDDNGVGYTLDGESAVVSIGMSVKGEVKIEESVEVGGKTYQVTAIAEGAFQGNIEITSVEIPNTVETIGGSAFEGCTGLSFISIGEAIKEIASRAFAGILGMTSTRADGEGIDVYCYSEDVPHTAEDIFDGTPTEKSTLHVPAKAVEAYRAAWPWSDFKEIVPLTDSSLNANGIIFTVKDDGTLEVTGLETKTTTADIPGIIDMDGKKYQVTSIAERAFEGRSNINYFSIPFSVTSIGSFAFMDCGNDMTVNIADLESWCKMELGNEHSSPLSSAKKVLVYDVETDEIDIPEGVTSIGNFTFYQCHSITSLSIPATVTSIGSSAFEDCTGLTSLTLSEGIESIGGSAFEGCSALESLTIPSTVNSISTNAFKNCKGITDVYCYAEAVPKTAADAFDGTPTEASTLHVPASAVEAYKAAWPWSDFKEIVAIEEGPDGIMGVRQSAEGNGDYYDLTGRKVQQLRKGLYIRNGKKVVIK